MKDEWKIRHTLRQCMALLWLVLLLTAQDWKWVWPWFKRWLARSAKNRAEFIRFERLWAAVRATRHSGVWRTTRIEPAGSIVNPNGRRRAILSIVTVVSVVCASCGWYFRDAIARGDLLQALAKTKSRGTYATVAAEQTQLSLSDGSEVRLNANSQVTLNLTQHSREVSLDKGTALFTVSKDANRRPFDVLIGNNTVRATGTIFAVTRMSAQVTEALVEQGSVDVFSKLSEKPGHLSAGEVARVTDGTLQMQKPRQSRIDARLAWTAGEFSFDGESLAEVVAAFNLYNQRQIDILDPGIAQLPVGGSFTANDPDGFARTVAISFGLQQTLNPAGSRGAGTIYLRRADTAFKQAPSTGNQDVGQEP